MATTKRDGTGSQSQKFKKTAHEAECDEDEARWNERLRKVSKHKPEDEKPND